MSGRRKFKELREKIDADPVRAARVARIKAVYDAIERLAQLRQALGMTQEQVANVLHVSQESVSRIEHRDDLYLSTVARYVNALGGRVVVEAVFDDEQRVDLSQLLALQAKEERQGQVHQA